MIMIINLYKIIFNPKKLKFLNKIIIVIIIWLKTIINPKKPKVLNKIMKFTNISKRNPQIKKNKLKINNFQKYLIWKYRLQDKTLTIFMKISKLSKK